MLDERGAEIDRIEIDEGDTLPDWRAYDAIVAMAGPMGADDDEALPWLADEKRLIAQAVEAGKPLWGVCLGVQLLAASRGARVRGPALEAGILPVTLTDDARYDAVFGLPRAAPDAQWHGDTFDLPPGAIRLVYCPRTPTRRSGVRNAYGVQFHLRSRPASRASGRGARVRGVPGADAGQARSTG